MAEKGGTTNGVRYGSKISGAIYRNLKNNGKPGSYVCGPSKKAIAPGVYVYK